MVDDTEVGKVLGAKSEGKILLQKLNELQLIIRVESVL